MKALHITSNERYRNPVGAALKDGAYSLTIDTWEGMARSCRLRVWQEGFGEQLFDMAATEKAPAPDGSSAPCRTFTCNYIPEHVGVVWYSFLIEGPDGSYVWYGAEEGWTTGPGRLYPFPPPSFQMTVYVPRPVQPDWYRKGIVYQIFPDRFARDDQWDARAAQVLSQPRKGPKRVLVDNWDEYPSYKRLDNGDIAQWDFYGGSLKGVMSKLDYLQALGVTVLYLNPIFEAASNHRYDTADYRAVDPILGTQEDFTELCRQAEERGMSVILDGVFNHSGQDSRYFNAYDNYEDCGAAQSSASPYRDWYRFNDDGTYESWWGVKDLPEYDEDCPSLRQYFCGEDGVIRHWLGKGAKGWRLDVADELPDSFIADIKRAALAQDPKALVIGEVWEDASHKYAYDKLRYYFQGEELDGVMNYPFRSAVIDYLTGRIHAPEAARRMQELSENYPADNFYCSLNLLGSHDRERILTTLGDAPHKDALTDEQKFEYRLSGEQQNLAKSRLRLAVLLQMTMPGVPSVYYGDEAGLQGYSDPFNRSTMPWENIDAECFGLHRDAIALRKSLPLFIDGSFEPVSFGNEVLGWWRRSAEESVCVLVNRSPWDWATVSLPLEKECVSELASPRPVTVENGQACVSLPPFGSSVLYFHASQQLQRPMEPGKGVIAHLTSIPNEGKPGTLGAPARCFVDWLAENGYTYWQMLPVNPTDNYGSPYAGLSAFAGNPALVEWPEDVDGYLEALGNQTAFEAFCAHNAGWLDAYAAFRAIKEAVGEIPWQQWDERYKTWNEGLLDMPSLSAIVNKVKREQFAFQSQWSDLKAYANAKGVSIIGDLPMYVSADSSDVWAHPGIFKLDAKGYPSTEAGVPPDALCEDGQAWGNPVYDWDVLESTGFKWWLDRLERMFFLYDYVRLDHFLGFSSYYTIDKGLKATEGRWNYGPARRLFEAAEERHGSKLPLIGENLGTITPAVRALVATCGFPGMDVIQFADNDVRDHYQPADNSLVYLGTHDTSTLVGWCQKHFVIGREEAQTLAKSLVDRTLDQQSDRVVMMQLQDVLLLGDEARMNVPGVAQGNWNWRCQQLP